MRRLAPGGDDAAVILPEDTRVTGSVAGTGVVVIVAVIAAGVIVAVVTGTISVVVPGCDVTFVKGIVVVLPTGSVTVVSAGSWVINRGSVPVTVFTGTMLEFVIFWLPTETGNKMNATITRIPRCMQIFFIIHTP